MKEPFFIFTGFRGDEAPPCWPGVLLHFALAILFSWAVLRMSGSRIRPLFSVVIGTALAFASGFLWRHISWDFWSTWDDLIIDPYKHLQILRPRAENVMCFLVFTLAPLIPSYLWCRRSWKKTTKRVPNPTAGAVAPASR